MNVASGLESITKEDLGVSFASKIAYVASHDLRAPVNHIKSYIRLLERDLKAVGQLVDEKVKSDLKAIEIAADRMELLLQALGRFADIPFQIEGEKIALQHAVKTATQKLDYLFQSKNIILDLGVLPEVQGDPVQLSILFEVLLHNAILYNRSDPIWLELSAYKEKDFYVCCLKDNGEGVPASYQRAIFEPSKRLHSLRDYPGVGMGLAIAERIVAAHGGKIWVESSGVPGEGAIFKFTVRSL